MIQTLKPVIGEAEHLVHRIVVETSDAGTAGAGGLRLEVQHLSDDARFPEQVTVERRTEILQTCFEVGNHSEAEEAVGRDLLIAAHALGEATAITAREEEERQPIGRARPQEVTPHRLLQRVR